MQFPNIIELIDEYLDRLIQVRRLLADIDLPDTQRKTRAAVLSRAAQLKSAADRPTAASENRPSSPKSVPRKTPKPAVQKRKAGNLADNPTKVDGATMSVTSVAASATVKANGPEKQSTERRSSVRARTRRTSKKRVAPSESPAIASKTALGGTIPIGPVVVSSQQIRIEQSLKQQETAVNIGPYLSPNTIPLTAELLTQRWVQGSQTLAR